MALVKTGARRAEGASARDCGGGCTGANGGNGRIEITYGGGSGPSYTYAGTGYANPHAPTTIDGLTLTYDNNGNVTAYGTNTYTYDYLNRMSKSVVGGITATSSYDHLNQRIKLQVGSTTTLYPSKLFSKTVFTNGATTTATTTAYIYVGDTLMALIDTASTNSTTTGTTTNFVHYDHLGSTVFLSNINGATTSAKDYYPFGALRIDTGASTTDKQYIGERYDPSSQLNYLNARMYDSARGQFMSQDPMFTGDPRQQQLTNPQSLNSYSYANNNPIVNKDPSGKWFVGLSGSENLFGSSFEYQLIGNFSGLNISVAPGFSTGASASPIHFEFNPTGQLSSRFETRTIIGAEAEAIIGANVSGTADLNLYKNSGLDNISADLSYTLGLSAGSAAYVRQQFTIPILPIPGYRCGVACPPIVNSSTFSTPNYSQQIQNQTSSQSLNTLFAPRSLNNSQASAAQGVATAFGFSSLSPAQTSAIQAVRAAFSK
jgi:RHS repeat-associated protein